MRVCFSVEGMWQSARLPLFSEKLLGMMSTLDSEGLGLLGACGEGSGS